MASNLPPGVRASDIHGNRLEDEAYEKMLDNFYASLNWRCFSLDEKQQAILDTHQQIYDVVEKAIEYGIKIGTQQKAAEEAEASFYQFQYLRTEINKILDKAEKGE